MRPLAVLLLAALPATAQVVWEHDLESAQKRARAEKKLILADVWTEWCGWCLKLQRDVFPSPQGQAALARVVPASLKTETRDGQATSLKYLEQRYGIKGYPTLLLLDPEGNVVRRADGYLPPKEFEAWVKGE
nr:thioredoxin fold domain-containing protein [uncultured Holophaga sp.]